MLQHTSTNLTRHQHTTDDFNNIKAMTSSNENTYAPTTQDELVQQICDAADMASKATRVNKLMSYISGVDYSQTQDSTHQPAGKNPDISNNNEPTLAAEDPLVFSKDQQFVFSVDANNESISSFRINEDYSLTSMSLNVPANCKKGTQKAISLTLFEDILYAVNTGNPDAGNDNEQAMLPPASRCQHSSASDSCVSGYRVADDGTLSAMADSELADLMC